MIEKLLQDKHIKVTKQRVDVLNSIMNLEIPTIKNILDNNKEINKSTIYRIIDNLVSNNIVSKVIDENNEVIYILNINHNHYLKCIKCHKKVVMDNCPFDHEIDGFQVINHYVNIEGICSSCQKK